LDLIFGAGLHHGCSIGRIQGCSPGALHR
jgi:hypothetical protein